MTLLLNLRYHVHRDLSTVLDPISRAYGSLLVAEPKSNKPSSRKKSNSNNNSSSVSDIESDDIKKNRVHYSKAGIVHLCQLVDCNSSLQALLASSHQ